MYLFFTFSFFDFLWSWIIMAYYLINLFPTQEWEKQKASLWYVVIVRFFLLMQIFIDAHCQITSAGNVRKRFQIWKQCSGIVCWGMSYRCWWANLLPQWDSNCFEKSTSAFDCSLIPSLVGPFHCSLIPSLVGPFFASRPDTFTFEILWFHWLVIMILFL